MPLFRLEKSEGDDMSKAELVIAPPKDLELESHLEDWLENSPHALVENESILWIGRQTSAKDEDGTIYSDLFGVDSQGNLVIAELKKGRTPRDIIAQILDYAAWAVGLSEPQICEIAEAYFETRGVFEGKTFDDAFREAFDIPETDELPRLNDGLRLFIVAEEIPSRVARVCRFLRTSHGINISCIDVSTFETKFGEVLISTETIIGDEDFTAPKTQQQERPSFPPQPPSDHPIEDIILEAVQEFTKGDLNAIFMLKDIEQIISRKHPDLAKSDKVRNRIRGSCVDFKKRHTYSPRGPDTYQWVSRGKYRLYDPKNDKVEKTDG